MSEITEYYANILDIDARGNVRATLTKNRQNDSNFRLKEETKNVKVEPVNENVDRVTREVKSVYTPLEGGRTITTVRTYPIYRGRDGYAGDICLYCGADNGPQGEFRNGWDCCYCGSN